MKKFSDKQGGLFGGSVYDFKDYKKDKAPKFRCYETHPPLKIGDFTIYGGSCSSPVVKDADVYVGLDYGMPAMQLYPWDHRVAFMYKITDMSVPDDPESFKRLIAYLHEQLTLGKKVHVGCIGGHGRTGMVLAALMNTVTGEIDAVTKVREAYCKKAVETSSQIAFLHKHFGIKQAKPTKTAASYGGSWSSSGGSYSAYKSGGSGATAGEVEIHPIATAVERIW